jgi:hypothetical protein
VRQGQQNRRGRGNNRNRKSQNPLSRSFESNGPDVKIRGTPAHIAEKYLTLARDAQSSGDPVLAENYFQHAEHYSRIIMAYREQLQQQGGDMANGNGQRMGGEGDDFGDDDGGDDMLDDGFSQPPMPQQHHGQSHQGQPHQQNRHSGYDANRDRPFRRDQNQNRFRDRDRPNERNDRGDRGDRADRGDRGDRGDRERQSADVRPNPVAQDRQPDAPVEAAGGGGEPPRRRDRFQQPHEQPEFLRRPVRRSRAESSPEPATPGKDEPRD